jgi:hypothetical protein
MNPLGPQPPDYRTTPILHAPFIGIDMTKNPSRKVIFLASLMGVLTVTSALLLALAPPPLTGESNSYDNLWAADTSGGNSDLTDAIFATRVPAQLGKWKYIYVHDSGTSTAAALGAGDHFVIAAGQGRPDGQIIMTQRWNNQSAAAAPTGVATIDPACISICVRGDFDALRPTVQQVRRLTELVSTLQSQLGIGGDKVFLLDTAAGPAGIGRQFPTASLRQQIFP